MNNRIRNRIFTVLGTLLLGAGCGGGGGGDGASDGGTDPGGGIDRGGITIALGPISGFGSVIVNGVRYSTSAAAITVNGQPGDESELRVGQIVRVEGRLDSGGTTGTATRVSYSSEVEGPVQSVDLAARRLVVLGQVVQVGADTSFDDGIVPRSLEGLRAGDQVEVSGLVRADGHIDATRIERRIGTGELELRGLVSSVDSAARRFGIGSQVVDYSAALVEGFPTGQPVNGDRVEVKGALDASAVLRATRIERKDSGLSGEPGHEGDLEGLVTRFSSAVDFDVAGQRVTTTGATRYEGGTAADLALNARVEVEGQIDSAGRLVAAKVEFRRASNLELAGPVDSVEVNLSRFSMLGLTVRTDSRTRFEDHSGMHHGAFGLGDLRVGDYVELRAYEEAGGLVATLIERDDSETEVELRGPATNVAQPNLTVSGVTVTTDNQTEFRGDEGGSITASEFFTAAPGREVKVRGTRVGNAVLAERIEFED